MSNIKHGILLNKAKKFFESFPERTSTILKMKVGNVDTHWNVVRQKGQLQITEINSNKNSFVIKEDEKTNVGGKDEKKPYLHDPDQKVAGKAVKPDPFKPGNTIPARSGWGGDKHQKDVRKSIKANPPQMPSATKSLNNLFSTGPQYQQAQTKMKGIRGTAKSDFEPDVIKRASQSLSDQEFGQFYGFTKQSALKRQSSPPPMPSRIKKAGTIPYDGNGPYHKGGAPLEPEKDLEKHGKETTLANSAKHKGKVIKEASPAFSKISAAFMEYMSKQNDHVAQSNFINTISREKMGLVNQQEKDSVAAIESQYLGQATKATDASTKQTPLVGMQQKQQQAIRKPLTQGVERKYRVVMKEADGEVKDTQDPSGLPNQNTPEEVPEQQPVEPQKTAEENSINKLAGQTIRSAGFESDENGNKLSLELAGQHIPATLEWNKTGKIIFSFKGARYTIKK